MHTVGFPRTCLSFTNFLFCILGSVLCFICIWCAINTEFFKDVNYTVTKSSYVGIIANFVNLKIWMTPMTTILIPVAFLAMLTSCCGIVGAGCKMQCALKCYIFLVSVISGIAFWIFFVSGMYNIYTNNQKTATYLQSTLHSYYGKPDDFITYLWNIVMVDHQCCGVTSFSDFTDSYWSTVNPNALYPVQCCVLNETSSEPISPNCTKSLEPEIQSNIYNGCMFALRDSIIRNKSKLIVYVILLAVSYLLLMFFALCIVRNMPLLGRFAAGAQFEIPEPPPVKGGTIDSAPSETSLDNMLFAEEPPKRIMKVVSAANPFQTYKFSDYHSEYQPPAVYPSNHIVYQHPHNIRRN